MVKEHWAAFSAAGEARGPLVELGAPGNDAKRGTQTGMEFIQDNIWLVLIAVVSGGMLAWSFLGPKILGIPQVGTLEATRLINQRDAVVLDVRDEGEYRAGHIPNSRHVPLTAIDSRLKELEKYRARPILVICRTGNRSGAAANLLRKRGFQEVWVLRGGLVAWEQANLPVERG